MKRWMLGMAIALVLTGCHSQDQANDEKPPSEADVRSGNTKDSADPRLNALQRTKRTLGNIESEHKHAVDGAGSAD